MISIDGDKCTSCERCYDVCPNYVFGVAQADGKRRTEVRYPSQCCECGHCISICPTEAVTGGFASRRDLEELLSVAVEPHALMNVLLSRRSVRSFTPQAVAKETIEQLLQAARHAGTASNEQAEGFIVIRDRDFLTRLEGLVVEVLWDAGIRHLDRETGPLIRLASRIYGPELVRAGRTYHDIIRHRRENRELHGNDRIGGMVFRNAPAVIVVHGDRRNVLGATNAALAIRNMELLAVTMGLGTCWVGFLKAAAGRSKKIDRLLELPNNRTVHGAVMVGHPKHGYRHKMARRSRDVRWM